MAFVGISLEEIKALLRAYLRACNETNADCSDKSSASTSGEQDDSYIAEYPGVLADDLFSPTRSQRSAFILIISMLFVLSVCGNVLTFSVNLRRQVRPFFRACLISLALSDLLNTLFLTVLYMSQFTAEYVQLWNFGSTMCNVVPLATTSAILVSSLTLVGIAVDRYFAVRKTTTDFWNPGCGFCLVCMVCIWTISITIACPIFFIYNMYYMYLVYELDTSSADASDMVDSTTSDWQTEFSRENESYTLVADNARLVAMCISNKDYVSLYYAVVFTIIFVPCIVAFIWLNSIIAKTIWLRRLPPKAAPTPNSAAVVNKKTSSSGCSSMDASMPSAKTMHHNTNSNNTSATAHSCSANTPRVRTTREARHVRMFVILILMMAVFLLCRLPAWILLLMRMYNTRMTPQVWMLYFSFGALNLLSCVLNPLFYTFLAQTIECVKKVREQVSDTANCLRLCCIQKYHNWQLKRRPHVAATPTECYGVNAGVTADPAEEPDATDCSCVACCGPLGVLRAKWRCGAVASQMQQQTRLQQQQRYEQATTPVPGKLDMDEGVVCSEEDDDQKCGQCKTPIYIIPTNTKPNANSFSA